MAAPAADRRHRHRLRPGGAPCRPNRRARRARSRRVGDSPAGPVHRACLVRRHDACASSHGARPGRSGFGGGLRRRRPSGIPASLCSGQCRPRAGPGCRLCPDRVLGGRSTVGLGRPAIGAPARPPAGRRIVVLRQGGPGTAPRICHARHGSRRRTYRDGGRRTIARAGDGPARGRRRLPIQHPDRAGLDRARLRRWPHSAGRVRVRRAVAVWRTTAHRIHRRRRSGPDPRSLAPCLPIAGAGRPRLRDGAARRSPPRLATTPHPHTALRRGCRTHRRRDRSQPAHPAACFAGGLVGCLDFFGRRVRIAAPPAAPDFPVRFPAHGNRRQQPLRSAALCAGSVASDVLARAVPCDARVFWSEVRRQWPGTTAGRHALDHCPLRRHAARSGRGGGGPARGVPRVPARYRREYHARSTPLLPSPVEHRAPGDSGRLDRLARHGPWFDRSAAPRGAHPVASAQTRPAPARRDDRPVGAAADDVAAALRRTGARTTSASRGAGHRHRARDLRQAARGALPARIAGLPPHDDDAGPAGSCRRVLSLDVRPRTGRQVAARGNTLCASGDQSSPDRAAVAAGEPRSDRPVSGADRSGNDTCDAVGRRIAYRPCVPGVAHHVARLVSGHLVGGTLRRRRIPDQPVCVQSSGRSHDGAAVRRRDLYLWAGSDLRGSVAVLRRRSPHPARRTGALRCQWKARRIHRRPCDARRLREPAVHRVAEPVRRADASDRPVTGRGCIRARYRVRCVRLESNAAVCVQCHRLAAR